MRSGLFPVLLALAALAAGAAPASAASTACQDLGSVIRCFNEDLGDGSVPSPGDYMNSSDAATEFVGMLVNPQTEDFEGFEVADKSTLEIFAGEPVTGWLSDTVVDGGSIRDFRDENRGFAISDDQFWKNETTSLLTDELFRVTFSEEVRAFGFYATAWSTESSPNMDATQLSLYLLRNGMDPERIEIPHDHQDLPGGVFYFGVIADIPFAAVALRNDSTTDPGDRIGFDGFTVAIVPEPSTALLLGAGLLGVAASRRRVARGA